LRQKREKKWINGLGKRQMDEMKEKFPEIKFGELYSQKGRMALFQIMPPSERFTTLGKEFGLETEPMALFFHKDIGELVFEKGFFDRLAEKYFEKLKSKEDYAKRFQQWLSLC